MSQPLPPEPPKPDRRPILKALGVAIGLSLCVCLVYASPLGSDFRAAQATPHAQAAAAHPAGAITFFLLGAIVVAAGVPRTAVSFLAGSLFGFWLGLLLALAIPLAAALLTFALTHWIRGSLFAGTRLPPAVAGLLDPIDHHFQENGFLAVLLTRQMPMPGLLANVLISLSSVKLGPFGLGSLLGFAPLAVVFVLYGSGLREDFMVRVLASSVALVIFSVVTYLVCVRSAMASRLLSQLSPTRQHDVRQNVFGGSVRSWLRTTELPSSCMARLTASWRGPSLVLAAVLLFILLIIPTVPVTNIMEARNLKAAEEIVESGHWFLPTLNGAPRILKPPLPTWACAAMGRLMGDTRNLFALRLPNGLVAFLLVCFVYLLVRDLYGRRPALLCALVLATTVQLIREAQIARWDLYTTAFACGGLWAACRVLAGTGKAWLYFPLAILLWTASYLSKGPVAFVLLPVPFLIAGFIVRHVVNRRPTPLDPPLPADTAMPYLFRALPCTVRQWALLTSMVVAAMALGHSWWWTLQYQYPETWKAVTGDLLSKFNGNTEPLYFYALQTPAFLAPWSLVLLIPFLLVAGDVLRRRRTPGLNAPQPAWRDLLFPLLWAMLGLLFLSLVPDKKSRYFLPLLPAFTVLIGLACERLMHTPDDAQNVPLVKYALRLHRGALFLVCVATPVAVFILTLKGASQTLWLSAPAFLLLALLVVAGKWDGLRVVFDTAMVTALGAAVLFLALPGTPWGEDYYRLAYPVKAISKGTPLYVVGDESHKLLWAVGRNYLWLDDASKLSALSWPGMVLADPIQRPLVEAALHANDLSWRLRYDFPIGAPRHQVVWYLYDVRRR
ncbi:MAG: hypothetical protein A3K19_14960 [Lentisphaerae bacterium RIFOXYB12_FULL_65_16]|nr:MAG: hypothetical protein A3K18_01540 [Lentisphaerae bacterium RIFOXYA12_64_32]OGV85934.1 MAG: hypothetical protein A3K19_14960 [Lentisphaerae bacterium RIFOXYB12_FULL_65_16]